MEFTRTQEVEISQKEMVSHLKQVLKRQGFKQSAEIRAPKASEGEDEREAAFTLVNAYNSQLASEVLKIAPEAVLLLTITFLVRQSGERTQVGVLDPEILSIIPERQDLRPVVEEMRNRIEKVLDEIKTPPRKDLSEFSADQVEERLYELILQSIDAISKGDPVQCCDQIFVLAKAYTAIASLKRIEEIELHLAGPQVCARSASARRQANDHRLGNRPVCCRCGSALGSGKACPPR